MFRSCSLATAILGDFDVSVISGVRNVPVHPGSADFVSGELRHKLLHTHDLFRSDEVAKVFQHPALDRVGLADRVLRVLDWLGRFLPFRNLRSLWSVCFFGFSLWL